MLDKRKKRILSRYVRYVDLGLLLAELKMVWQEHIILGWLCCWDLLSVFAKGRQSTMCEIGFQENNLFIGNDIKDNLR